MKRLFMMVGASLFAAALIFGGLFSSALSQPVVHARSNVTTVNFDLNTYLFVIGAGAVFDGGLTTNVVNIAFNTKIFNMEPNKTYTGQVMASDSKKGGPASAVSIKSEAASGHFVDASTVTKERLEAQATREFTITADSSGNASRNFEITMQGLPEAPHTLNTTIYTIALENSAGMVVGTASASATAESK